MSVRTMAKVWELSRHSGSHLALLLALAYRADDDGRTVVSVAELAAKCRLKRRQVQYILKDLRECGDLAVEGVNRPCGRNRFRVLVGVI